MKKTDFLGTGWAFPLQTEQGRIAVVEGENTIERSIRIILGTSKGERVMRPKFGCNIHQFVFAENNSNTASLIAYQVKEALLDWEPRITVNDVRVKPTGAAGNELHIEIYYTVKTSNIKRNIVYPFYIEGK